MSFFDLFRSKEREEYHEEPEPDITPTPSELAYAKSLAEEKYEKARRFVDKHYKPSNEDICANPYQYKPAGNNGSVPSDAGVSSASAPSSTSAASPSVTYKGSSESAVPFSNASGTHTSFSSEAKYSLSEQYREYDEDEALDAEFSASALIECLYKYDRNKDLDPLKRMMEDSFSAQTRKLMEEKGLTAAEVYKKAQIDKSTFSKILSLLSYSPTKDTAIAVCLGLTLSLTEAKLLLNRAGFTLSKSILRDVLICFCIETHMYDVVMVNCLLEKFGCRPLGRS